MAEPIILKGRRGAIGMDVHANLHNLRIYARRGGGEGEGVTR